MQLLTDTALRTIQLEILDEIHAFCQANGIRYSLTYGTLLGAVRHKGYIPWDDDIDLMMPRPDYERFINEFTSSQNEMIILKNIDSCVEMFTKICRKGTKMVDKELGRCLWGVNVDVFPVDGCPSVEHQERITSKKAFLAKICPRYKVITKQKLLWFLKYLVKRIVFVYPRSVLHLKEELDSLSRCNPALAPKAGLLMEGKGTFKGDSSFFEDYVTLPFEGKHYCAIRDYACILQTHYGDYMTPPPPEKRISRHQYDAFICD